MEPSKKPAQDIAPPAGDWLVRHDALVIGPLPGAKVVEKLYSGELDARSEVSRLGSGLFEKLGELDAFKVHLAKAAAKRRVDAQAEAQAQQSASSRNLKLGAVAALALVVALGMGLAMHKLAVRAPWKNADELAFADAIEVEAPIITRARARSIDEELIAYPGAEKSRRPPERSVDRPRPAVAARWAKAGKGDPDELDGMQTAKFDQEAINSVVRARQRSLFPCLAAEAQKRPGLAAKIPIEFTIGNDGRVAKVWVDHPQFKEGSLPACLLRELQKWPFKPYEGERATVGLSFKVGKTG